MNIDICICTYRRASLTQTLVSLEQLVLKPDWQLNVIIADNDAVPSAQPLVDDFARHSKLEINYVHAPKQNIAIARNACLAHSTAEWTAFIDDDETVSPQWLVELFKTAHATNAEVVLGPVQAIYPNHLQNSWMSKGDFHATRPTFSGETICSGYTCNVLIHRSNDQIAPLLFDERFGRTGGEDTLFFEHIKDAGIELYFSPNAWVYEPVPSARSSFKWLMTRRFRFGQTHARLLIDTNGSLQARAKHTLAATAKAIACFSMAGLNLFDQIKWRRWTIRGCLHIGVISRLIAQKDVELYGH
ncbi:glycosyltransferase family 2 protein [Vibrio sp. SCSIO 43135]|uniref:glycosyltransferase n=1 Tax=Vibrio sp. SCSIO 43135 TaxID=2819096 RepID=UPI002075A0BB|nr:glycosyltransferase family 2 protein [Vibrio sp. SCSIO 43135]USD43119.1 glycosyltransferase family 2 protein [Vibrio sp. SCSIO 43135]